MLQRLSRADVLKVGPDLFVRYLRVINIDMGPFVHEVANEGDGGRLAGVPSIRLECESKNGNTLYNPKDLNLYLKF